MELVVPIIFNGRAYTEFEKRKLRAGVIADATEQLSKKGDFPGMLTLVSKSLKSLSSSDGDVLEGDFENAIRNAPIQAVEIMALAILTEGREEGLEQISTCPRCKNQIIYEDEDALMFEDLEILPLVGDPEIHIDLEDPIEVKSKGEVIETVTSITFRYPLLKDGIKGSGGASSGSEARRTYAIYAQSIIRLNGEDVDSKTRNSWGLFILERMSIDDMEKISEKMRSCGIKKTVGRVCRKCGKKWNDRIDISGFFEEGLQL